MIHSVTFYGEKLRFKVKQLTLTVDKHRRLLTSIGVKLRGKKWQSLGLMFFISGFLSYYVGFTILSRYELKETVLFSRNYKRSAAITTRRPFPLFF